MNSVSKDNIYNNYLLNPTKRVIYQFSNIIGWMFTNSKKHKDKSYNNEI